MMNTLAKRALAGGVALSVAAACCFGAFRVYQSSHSSVVKVYDINELTSGYSPEDTRTEGVVSTDQFQSEYLSDTQTVKSLEVKEGQKVKKGDILFTYDSTLTEIDLKRKQIEVQQKQIEVSSAQKELNRIKTYRPGKPIPGSSHSYRIGGGGGGGKEPVPVYEGLELVAGDGQSETPFSYVWKDTFLFGDDLMSAAMQGKVDCYVRFYLEGKEVPIPGPEPTPEPEPEPTPEPTPEPEPEPTPVPEDESEEQKPKPDQSDDHKPEDGSSESGNAQELRSAGSESQSFRAAQDRGEVAVPLSGREDIGSLEQLYLLTRRPLSYASDGSEGESDGSGSGDSSEEEGYSAAWVYHCQRTVSGYRYVLLSMDVGGVQRVVGEAFPPMSDQENPEKQKKQKSQVVKDPGIKYTAAEIAAMRLEQENAIRDAKLEMRQLEVELEKLEKEMDNSAVYSALDGIVLELNDPKDLDSGTPVLKVSGGGGYLVRGSISELALDSVQPGQKVSISDWSSGGNYEGTVKSISDYPSSSGGWSDGNTNVSYYGFTVSVDGSANLEQNSYVEMSYSAGSGGATNSTYLLTSFIRREGNKSYILYERDGKLVKQYVRTGKSMWGMYTEILGGLKPELYLAFPYGKSVREGASTQHSGTEELYGM